MRYGFGQTRRVYASPGAGPSSPQALVIGRHGLGVGRRASAGTSSAPVGLPAVIQRREFLGAVRRVYAGASSVIPPVTPPARFGGGFRGFDIEPRHNPDVVALDLINVAYLVVLAIDKHENRT